MSELQIRMLRKNKRKREKEAIESSRINEGTIQID